MIKIREAFCQDLPEIMRCYEMAREFMRKNGNTFQWTNGYPSKEFVKREIENGHQFVGVDSKGKIVMTFSFILGIDPTYLKISDGEWLNDKPYGTIHRLASDGTMSGILKQCVEYCLYLCDNIRLDTHEVNEPMKTAVTGLGFIECGSIVCQDGTPRIAYHLDKSTS